MNDILTLHDQARRLADIHGTSLDYELDRKAREHGHTSWQAMVEAQLSHLQVALGLKQRWLRPATENDGDVGGWPILPAYNPLLPEHLPPEGCDRDIYIHAVATLLVKTSNRRNLADRDEDYASRLAATFLRWEVADALLNDRVPTPIEGGSILPAVYDRIYARPASTWADDYVPPVFREFAREWQTSDPEGAALLEELAAGGYGWSLSVLDNARHAFLRFRHPAIAKLVA